MAKVSIKELQNTDVKYRKADNWYKYLLYCSKHEPWVLADNGILVCNAPNCHNGLVGVGVGIEDNYSWSGEYCKKCNGYGFLFDENKIYEFKTCPICNGDGCEDCEEKGIVDWVTFIQLKAKRSHIS
jgi:hypothetical protein